VKRFERCEAREGLGGPWEPAKFSRTNTTSGNPMVYMRGSVWEREVRAVRPIPAVVLLARLVK